jgi:hypothetical protein
LRRYANFLVALTSDEWSGMHYWLAVGILLAGCGIGALLTAAIYLTQLRKVKAALHIASLAGSQHPSRTSQDLENIDERSA